MILDNKQQKNLLINIIRNTQLQGRYRDLKNDIEILDNLLQAVQNAEVKILPRDKYEEPKIKELKDDVKEEINKENHPSPSDGEPPTA